MRLTLLMLRPFVVAMAAGVVALPVAAEAIMSGPTLAGTMTDARVDESSSLAISTAYPGIAYTANDENDPVYAVEIATGRIVGSARLMASTVTTKRARVWVPKRKHAANPAVTCQTKAQRRKYCKKVKRRVSVVEYHAANLVDPEAMALDTAGAVWLADTGDNAQQRGGAVVYSFAQPGTGDHPVAATRYPISYPGGGSYNVETLLINPVTNAKYLVTKNSSGAGKLFALPSALSQTTPNTVIDTGMSLPAMVSDGDFSPHASHVILRDGTEGSTQAYVLSARTWARLGTLSVPNSSGGKGESVSFSPNEPQFLTSREGEDAPLYWVPFDEAKWATAR